MLKVLSVAVALLFSANVNAALWKLDFSGQLDGITEYLGEISSSTRGTYNFHEDRFYLGQIFYGHVLIDDSVLPGSTLATDPEKDIYAGVIDQYLNIDGYIYRKGSPYPSYAQVWNRGDSNAIKDVFTASGNTYDRPFYLGPGDDLSSFTISLFDRDGDVFNSTSLYGALDVLSSSASVLDLFEYKNLSFLHNSQGASITNQYLFMDGEFQTLSVSKIPTPNSIWLLLIGLPGIFLIKFRSKIK